MVMVTLSWKVMLTITHLGASHRKMAWFLLLLLLFLFRYVSWRDTGVVWDEVLTKRNQEIYSREVTGTKNTDITLGAWYVTEMIPLQFDRSSFAHNTAIPERLQTNSEINETNYITPLFYGKDIVKRDFGTLQTLCAIIFWSHLTRGLLLGFLEGVGILLLSAFITSSM